MCGTPSSDGSTLIGLDRRDDWAVLELLGFERRISFFSSFPLFLFSTMALLPLPLSLSLSLGVNCPSPKSSYPSNVLFLFSHFLRLRLRRRGAMRDWPNAGSSGLLRVTFGGGGAGSSLYQPCMEGEGKYSRVQRGTSPVPLASRYSTTVARYLAGHGQHQTPQVTIAVDRAPPATDHSNCQTLVARNLLAYE